MFWNRSSSRPKDEVTPPKPARNADSAEADLDRALDTLRAVLSIYGQFAFDTDRASATEVHEQCSALIRRVVLADNRSDGETEVEVAPSELDGPHRPRRDWGSVHRYLDEQRKHEHEFVTTSFVNFRQALREFAQCLTAAVSEDRANDKQVELQLSRLMSAAVGSDTEVIRREALAVSDLVRDVISRRRDREAEQLLQLGKQVKLLRDELEQVRTQAALDPLTQLFNRATFDEEIDKVARLGLLLGSEPCLIMVDIDHFKLVNDQYGHPSGDAALKVVADNLVRHFLRKEDFVSRYGGEEFAIVVRDSTLEKVASRADRAREVLAQIKIPTPKGPLSVTQSAGVAALVPGETPTSWIARADKALYWAKDSGRNRVAAAPVVL